MSPQETAQILAKMATYDSRNVADVDVLAWHEIIGHLDYADCLTAVTGHYRENNHRAMPADIRKLATDLAARRRGHRERAERQITVAGQRGEPKRTGAAMCKFVLGRLKEAGQDIPAGKRLGRERAADVAEQACQEWLNLTADLP